MTKRSEQEIRKRLDTALELAHDPEFYSSPAVLDGLLGAAYDLFHEVLDHFGLTYFNPGEPVAENESEGISIPLTGDSAEFLVGDDEENVPDAVYWARLWAQRTLDILDDGWQNGLGEW